MTECEEWQAFRKGDFLVFKDGCLAFKNGERVMGSDEWSCVENVEVYDTSEKLDNMGSLVIGVSKQLRDKLGIRVGNSVHIQKHGEDRTVALRVRQTDRRLLKGRHARLMIEVIMCASRSRFEILGD